MRRRQWLLSVLLFAVSFSFLLFSKYIFSPSVSRVPESFSTVVARQSNITVLANKDYYPVLKEYFRRAEKSIAGSVYLFKTSHYRENEPADLLRELTAARKRNVEVDLVVEVSSEFDDTNQANQRAAEILRKAGIKVRFDNGSVTTHAKVFVIDDRYCFVGSHNLTHAAMSMNQELSLLIDSTDLAQEINQFLQRIPLSAAQ